MKPHQETLWVIREIEEYLKNPDLYCGYHSTTPEAMAEYIVDNLRILRTDRDFCQKVAVQATQLMSPQTRRSVLQGGDSRLIELRTWFEQESARDFQKIRGNP